jgi:hypothetical protein
MLKVIACLICYSALLAVPLEDERPVRVTQSSAGMALVARTGDGFALAVDGAQANADGTLSQVQKMFPAGKNGAAILAGNVSIQDPISRPMREEVNVATIAGTWLQAHPDADIRSAAREINSEIARNTTKFFSTRDPGTEKGKYAFAVIFAGFDQGKPWLSPTRYFMPVAKGSPMRTQPVPGTIPSGEIRVFGNSKVEQELLSGNSAALKSFKAEAAVKTYRSRPAAERTLQDYVNVFDVILRAAESEEGKKLTGGNASAAPPNRFATVTVKDGFAWSKR